MSLASSLVRVNSFGNVSGVIDETKVLGVEIGNDQPKTISVISASFRVPNGETLATKPFLYSAVAVFRGKVISFPHPLKLKDVEQNSDLEYLRFFNHYEGFTDNVYISAEKTEVLSVILFAPYLQADPVLQAASFGNLSVWGSFAQEQARFEVAKA